MNKIILYLKLHMTNMMCYKLINFFNFKNGKKNMQRKLKKKHKMIKFS